MVEPWSFISISSYKLCLWIPLPPGNHQESNVPILLLPFMQPPPSCRPGTAAKCPAPKFKGPPRCASPSPWQNPQCKPTAPHVNAGNSRAAAPGAGHAMKPGPTQAKSSAKACWQSGPSIQCTPAHPATALTDPDTVSPSPKMPLFSSHFGEAAEELAEIVCPTPVKGHPFEAGDWGLAGVALCPAGEPMAGPMNSSAEPYSSCSELWHALNAALRWEALPEMIRTRQNLDSLLAPWKRVRLLWLCSLLPCGTAGNSWKLSCRSLHPRVRQGQDTPLLAMLLAHEGSGRLGEALATEVQASYFVINSELLESSFVRVGCPGPHYFSAVPGFI